VNRVRVGQVLLWTELEWDRYYCGQNESGTVIIGTECEWDRYYCGQSDSGTGIIVDRVRVGQVLLWTE